MKKTEAPKTLDEQAEELLEEWASSQGLDLRQLGILNAERRRRIARREIPLSRFRRERDEEEDYD
jgi:hypothetical protein